MNTETLLTILGSNVIVAVFSYITGIRKTKADTDNTILAGLEQSVSIYQDIVNSLRDEIKTLNQKISHLESRIEELYKENKSLKSNL